MNSFLKGKAINEKEVGKSLQRLLDIFQRRVAAKKDDPWNWDEDTIEMSKKPKCECGAQFTQNPSLHASYCPLYFPPMGWGSR